MTPQKIARAAAFAAALAVLFALVQFRGGEAYARNPEYKIKLGTIIPAMSPWGKVSKEFANKIGESTGGQVEIKVYYGGTLGDEQSILEQLRMGTIQAAAVTSGGLAAVVPEAQAFELPFLFDDLDEARYLTDKVIGPIVIDAALKRGMFAQAIAENGFADFIADKPIRTPDDLKGRKFASEPSDLRQAFWESLGAAAVPMALSEIFQGLQRGMVDGADNSILAIMSFNLHNKKKWITMSNHSYQPGIVLMNKKYWDTIPPDLQQKLIEGNAELAGAVRAELSKSEEGGKRALQATGVKFYEWTPEERQAFVDRVEPVYKKFAPVIGEENLKKILDARDEYREGKDAK